MLWEMKPGSTILKPNQRTNQRMAPYKKYKEEDLKSMLAAGKKHGWDQKGVILMKFLPRVTTKNSYHYTEMLGTPNDYLHRVCPTRNMSEV
jgi:hypothetical protein